MTAHALAPPIIKIAGKYILQHPAAAVFPLVEGAAFDALVEDIRKQGQLEPVIMFKGMVLDGRNRIRACDKLGIPPRVAEWSGKGDPLEFVISYNIHRRHLTQSQRAMIGARLANMKSGTRTDLVSNHTRFEISLQQAANIVGVARVQVSHARTVLGMPATATRPAVPGGTPEEIAKVDSGNAKVSTMATIIRKRQEAEGTRTPQGSRTKKPDDPAPNTAEIVVLHPNKGTHKRTYGLGPKMPNGETPEFIARRALAMRGEGMPITAISEQLKIASMACSSMIDIVLIADREDLCERETAVAAAALDRLNDRTVPMETIVASITPIAQRLWGDVAQSHKGRKAIEEARLDRFERAVNTMLQCCTNGTLIPIPQVPGKRRAELTARIKQARNDLNILIERLRSAHE